MAYKATRLVATLVRKLGVNKGAPRLWLEGIFPSRAGFAPGARYTVSAPDGEMKVVLKIDDSGVRLVSAKTKADRTLPVIDLNSKELLDRFVGMDTVRVVMLNGEIHILADAVEVKKAERRRRLEAAIEHRTMTVASVSHGIGVLSNALHVGLRQAGFKPKLLWACEIREEVINQAAHANDAWDEETVGLAMPLQQLAFADEFTLSRLQRPVLLEGGLPCTAASMAGRAKKGLAKAEDDETAGHLIAAFIALIARVNPCAVMLENVMPYWSTASASILRTQLKELGYDVQERELHGEDYVIEARPRRVLVAVTQGVDLDLAAMVPPPKAQQTIADVLEPIAEDDPMWSPMQYLKDKEVRDQAAGKGFKMQVVTPDATRVGTLGTGYQKNRSTEGKVQHPTKPELMRLFTPTEHARLKGIPESMIEGVTSRTFAHEILGQSVIWPAFRQLGEHLGQALGKGLVKAKAVLPAVVKAAPDQEATMPLFQAA
ncbi:MAG: hypothetical protein A2580_09200 [Hydrogenophilales bacterium RIFOXYD1_FULL_62_11]|nr:MAG: hypothetical protein A2580_09200 [Hydrogenophilales bacterium RIFOXYD1_FULL_62_11]